MANTHPTTSQPKAFPRIITSLPSANEPQHQQNFPRAGASSHIAQYQSCDVEADSLRSRASSVISTGTRFSISTLPVDEPSQVEGLLGRLNHASAFRPRSVMSTNSYDQPAPPYESRSTADLPFILTTQNDTASSRHNSIIIEDPAHSPTISSENSLTMHYSRVVRTIDQNHNNQMRRLKEAHQEELGATRNAIDQTYRKELRAQAREVEKMREEMASLTATHEADVARLQREAIEQATDQSESHRVEMERACNAIEDLWEARWSDRIRLAAEEARKANTEFQSRCEAILVDKDRAIQEIARVVRDRDEAWRTEIINRYPELGGEVHAISDILNRTRDASVEEVPNVRGSP